MLGIAAGEALGGLAHLDHQPLLGRLERREGTGRLGIVAKQAGEPALEQGLRGLLDPPASPRQFIGALDQLLQPFFGIMPDEESARRPELDPSRLAPRGASRPRPGLAITSRTTSSSQESLPARAFSGNAEKKQWPSGMVRTGALLTVSA